MLDGLITLPWWGYVLVALGLTHITIVTVTVFLHRCQAHRGLDLHPIPQHFFRFWNWLTTGMVTRQWVAIHRKHHAKCETPDDPHSPQVLGLKKVLREGAELYRAESYNEETMDKYGKGTPDDWLERNIYTPHPFLGVTLMAVIDLLLFGPIGLTIWAVQMLWIPFWAAGVINGVGHFWGYRSFEPKDASTNISPWGIVIGGEELHNNHHAFPSSAKFSVRQWEFDIGWMYISILKAFRLVKIKRIYPRLMTTQFHDFDVDALRAVVTARLHVLSDYAHMVLAPTWHQSFSEAGKHRAEQLKNLRFFLMRNSILVKDDDKKRLLDVLSKEEALDTVYRFREELQEIWDKTHATQDALLQAMQDWCHRAEQTGIDALEHFAQHIRGYRLATV